MSSGDPPSINGLRAYGAGLTATWQTLNLNLPENEDFKALSSRLYEIEKRLAILRPDEELQARFPALQEAYDHYKLIEKLVNDQAKNHI